MLAGPGKACVQALCGPEHANLLLLVDCTCGFTAHPHSSYIEGSLDQRRPGYPIHGAGRACERLKHMQALERHETSFWGYVCPDIWQNLSSLAIALKLRRAS